MNNHLTKPMYRGAGAPSNRRMRLPSLSAVPGKMEAPPRAPEAGWTGAPARSLSAVFDGHGGLQQTDTSGRINAKWARWHSGGR